MGWLFQQVPLKRADSSDLRLDIQDVSQWTGLQAPQPVIGAKPVFCDTAKFTLLLAHNRQGANPIVVHRVSIKDKVASAEGSAKCVVDPLASKHAGIQERQVFVISFSDEKSSGRFIRSGQVGDAWQVSANNLLSSPQGTIDIRLASGEAQTSFDVFVTSRAKEPREIWIEVAYDVEGARTKRSDSFLLASVR